MEIWLETLEQKLSAQENLKKKVLMNYNYADKFQGITRLTSYTLV